MHADMAPNVLHDQCPSRHVLEVIGDKWTILIIHGLRLGYHRPSALQRMIRGIAPKVLTGVLRRLEDDGLVARTVHPTVPPKVEYFLTEEGESLGSLLSAMCAWAEGHFPAIEQARAQARERRSGG